MCTIVFFLLVIFASGLQAGESHFSTAGVFMSLPVVGVKYII